MLVSKKEKKELTYFFLSISLAATSSTLPIFPESQTESKTAAPTTLTHAGVGTEPRSCPVWLHAWLRGLHHPYKVARLRSERPRRHTSGDESGSLYTPPPTPPPGGINVLVMSDSSQAAKPGSPVGVSSHQPVT